MNAEIHFPPPHHGGSLITSSGTTVHLYLNTVRRQGADGGGAIGRVCPGSRTLLCELVSSRPQLGAAAARVGLKLPARNQVGIQTC